jgi:hypothetical protein
LLPATLEEFRLAAHARGLLSIPRVVALEPSRVRPPRFMREATSIRQARKLKFPGRPRVLVLYDPEQYTLARALSIQYDEAELWYLPPETVAVDDGRLKREREALDELARQDATCLLTVSDGDNVDDAPLRERLREVDVINARPFVPGRRSR